MGDLKAGIDQARYPLELGAMLARDRQRVRDIAGIADLGRICIALPQKRAGPGAGGEREHDAAARKNSPAEAAEASAEPTAEINDEAPEGEAGEEAPAEHNES